MVVNSDAGVDASVLRHHVTDLQQDVPRVSAEQKGERSSDRKREQTKTHGCSLPDVYGEPAAAGYRVLIGAFQSDGGFGSSTDFTAQNHRLPKRTHHI